MLAPGLCHGRPLRARVDLALGARVAAHVASREANREARAPAPQAPREGPPVECERDYESWAKVRIPRDQRNLAEEADRVRAQRYFLMQRVQEAEGERRPSLMSEIRCRFWPASRAHFKNTVLLVYHFEHELKCWKFVHAIQRPVYVAVTSMCVGGNPTTPVSG